MTRIVLFGAGRMAEAITRVAQNYPAIELLGVVSRQPPDWQHSGTFWQDLGDIRQVPDVLVDFSLPAGTRLAAQWCADKGVALLSGVTGLEQSLLDELQLTAARAAVLWSANMSVGVNLLAQMCQTAAGVLPADVCINIHDVHHQWKKDAPSGTALMLAQAVARGQAGSGSEPTFSSLREGEVIGLHSVCFTLAGERIELTHEATDRSVFARGAVEAALWLSSQQPGYYSASDWLSQADNP